MPLHCQLLLAALVFTCHPVRSAELVLVWNDLTLRAIRYANIPPPMAVRQMAIVHLAIFDAANGIDPKYDSYLVTNTAPGECSLEAGTSTAAHHVLRTLFPKSADLLDSHYNAILAAIPNTTAKTNGLQWGKQVATEYLKLRQFDGAGQSAGYSYKEQAGYWKRTPPNYDKPLLPAYRIVAYYGHPNDENMGILGQFSMQGLLGQLLDEAAAYERADAGRPVMPAFEIVYSVAQSDPGPDGKYLLHTDDATMREYIAFTQENNILLVIDIQLGKATIQEELAQIGDYLKEPNVHLAIDPEFAWGPEQIPGVDFGSVDAKDINYAQDELARVATENNLPPKLLIVHRFTDGMVTNINRVKAVEQVQFVLDFDGFGDPLNKEQGYQLYVRDSDVPFGGIKLFYDQDQPLMQPAEVVELDPSPDFVMYQ